MLVVTTFGIFIPSLRSGSLAEGEPELQVRSRRASDLDQLRERYMGDTLGPTIYGKGATDYQYRAFCTRAAWAHALANIALDIDYLSAKHAVEGDKTLEQANVRIWEVLLGLFPTGSKYGRVRRQGRAQPAAGPRPARGFPWEGQRTSRRTVPPALFSDEEWHDALAMEERPRF